MTPRSKTRLVTLPSGDAWRMRNERDGTRFFFTGSASLTNMCSGRERWPASRAERVTKPGGGLDNAVAMIGECMKVSLYLVLIG